MYPRTRCKPSGYQLSLWKSLNKPQSRHRAGLFLAEGFKVVTELLKSTWKTEALLVMEEKKPRWEAFLAAVPDDVDIYNLTGRQWRQLSQDKNPEGIMAVAAPTFSTDFCQLPDMGHIILAYRMNNPNNLGALVRTAHWFGFQALLLSADSVDFMNPKVVRTSMGSLFHLQVIHDLDLGEIIPSLKQRYLVVAGDVKKGAAPHPCTQKTALLLGNESHGLPDWLLELADERWNIPAVGNAESLSLTPAAAIMMYETVKTTG